LAAAITKVQEDVGGRVKPGQGDLWLCTDREGQPIPLNRTAVRGGAPLVFSPRTGLDPGIHALAAEITKVQQDVDAHGSSPWAVGPRVKPGPGNLCDLWLSKDRCRQPISLNRTAVGLPRWSSAHGLVPSSSTPSGVRSKDVDTRDKPAADG